MAVDPGRADVQRLISEDPGGPVVMLNLLRFAPDGARTYREYARRRTARPVPELRSIPPDGP